MDEVGEFYKRQLVRPSPAIVVSCRRVPPYMDRRDEGEPIGEDAFQDVDAFIYFYIFFVSKILYFYAWPRRERIEKKAISRWGGRKWNLCGSIEDVKTVGRKSSRKSVIGFTSRRSSSRRPFFS